MYKIVVQIFCTMYLYKHFVKTTCTKRLYKYSIQATYTMKLHKVFTYNHLTQLLCSTHSTIKFFNNLRLRRNYTSFETKNQINFIINFTLAENASKMHLTDKKFILLFFLRIWLPVSWRPLICRLRRFPVKKIKKF